MTKRSEASPRVVLLMASVFLGLGILPGCGDTGQPDSIAVPISHSDANATDRNSTRSAATAGSPSESSTPEAGRYANYIKQNPVSSYYTPYEPKLLFYSLYVNCLGCHEFVGSLAQVKSRLEKNKPNGSIQDKILSGSMPPNKPKFATSPEGKELLDLLNKL
ncbi:MAG: hypothetical protein ACO3A4_00090 [Silvanigrellaceae bacterium]